MLVHIERDQLLEPADRVKRVLEQPLVFDRSPPRFDERLGDRDIGHGEASFEKPGLEQRVDRTVEVLAPTVIEKPNQRRIDMPDLVGTGGSNADLGLGRVDAQSRPSPFVWSR